MLIVTNFANLYLRELLVLEPVSFPAAVVHFEHKDSVRLC